MTTARILIVSTETDLGQGIRERLRLMGYEVTGLATSADDAISLIRQQRPNIIVTDSRLRAPGGGYETGRLFQSIYGIPVVYIAGSLVSATLQQARATGPFGYIIKPYDDKQILVTIETALLRHELETEVLENRQWLNTILTSIGDGVIATDDKGMVRFINPVAVSLTGSQYPAAIGKPLYEILPLIDETSAKPVEFVGVPRQAGGPMVSKFEGMLVSGSGKRIPVEGSVTAITGQNGESLGMVLVVRDNTKQRAALDEIRSQADRAQALVQVASQLTGQLELDAVLETICRVTNQVVHATATGVLLRDSKKGIMRGLAAYTQEPALLAFAGNSFEVPLDLVSSLLPPDEPVVVIPDVQTLPSWTYSEFARQQSIGTALVAVLFRGKQRVGALVSVFKGKPQSIPPEDVALLKGLADQASGAIENAELFEQVLRGREREWTLAKSLVDVQEAERRHTAHELHDGLGQALTGVQFMLEDAKTGATGPEKAQLQRIQSAVTEAMGQVRELSLRLRPAMLDDLGLFPTLRWHFGQYTGHTGIKVDLQCENQDGRFAPDTEIAAFRIIQEALTNVARHAQVKDVFVAVAADETSLHLEVVDRGKGFDAAAALDKVNIGLSGMRERAELLGGRLLIESHPGQGTRVSAALPLLNKPLERRKRERIHSAGG